MNISKRSPEPFFYSGGNTGILLIHGFTGTPSEMRPMGQYLKDRGYTVYAPLLAGHGTSPEEMEKTGWKDWWKSVLDAYERLKNEGVEKLFVAGLSMGGALSLYLAAQKPVDGVIAMCSPVWIKDRRALIVDLIRLFIPYKVRSSHKDPEIEAHLVPYDRTPLKCVSSLNRLIRQVCKCMPRVQAPALVIQSRNDETVVPKSADYIYEHISSPVKYLSWYENSSHIITLDKERRKLFHEVEDFVRKIAHK
ncbi:alpha/beta hydrolase [Paenactinomyces guangxiensis]|uniref:alpha/beta hydrolase n=1 Tax=Paenactinomyces guangxiensis TaxID=1490290 RepID=UPI002867F031|nr:alpha/beta fold hydrolase [Paenactinomyces guangxiensis]